MKSRTPPRRSRPGKAFLLGVPGILGGKRLE
jgi:hypothetical protein